VFGDTVNPDPDLRRGAHQRLRQDRPRGAGVRAARGRRRDRLDRQLGGRIAAAGVPVTPVEELTGFPECLDGRVKTLHPGCTRACFADIGNSQHVAQLVGLRIEAFQLLVSNLYPFEATVASGASPDAVRGADRHQAALPWSGPRPRTTARSPS